MRKNEPKYSEIGIHICLNCPYDDCIATNEVPCHLIMEEAVRVKNEAIADDNRAKQQILDNIQAAIDERGPLTIAAIRKIYDYEYEVLARLIRTNRLEIKRSGGGKKKKIIIVGVC